MNRIGVISNLKAGRRNKGVYYEKKLNEIFGPHAFVAVTETIDQLYLIIEKFLSEGVDLLCIDGGDGTIQKIFTEWITQNGLKAELPKLALLRGGTGNVTAIDLGIKGHPLSIAQRVKEYLVKSDYEGQGLNFISRHLLQIESSFLERTEYGFIVANGIIMRAVQKYYARSNPSLFDAFMVIIKIIIISLVKNRSSHMFLRRMTAGLTIDGVEHSSGQFTCMLATSLNSFFFTIKPFDRDPFHEEGFNFAALSLPMQQAIKYIYAIFRGQHSTSLLPHDYFNDRVNKISFRSSEGIIIDGELFPCDTLNTTNVTLGPIVKFLKLPNRSLYDVAEDVKYIINQRFKY